MNPWILAARPKTLLASVCPVAIGTALAYRHGVLHWPSALVALIGALAIQIGTNFSNDYFDCVQGADRPDRKGPVRAVAAGLVTRGGMLRATLLAFAVVAVCAGLLAWRAGWPIAVLGGVSIVLGIMYTAGRYSLAYLGLGDLFVLIFFGPVAVAGTYFVQSTSWTNELFVNLIIAGIAPGLISVAILVINNLRDIDEDRASHKRTLAVRFGADFARAEYAICMTGAAVVPAILWARQYLPASALAAALMITPGFRMSRLIRQLEGAALNPLLGKTAGVLLGYTLIFCVGCVIAWKL